jgi:nitrite reductase/ring-hydroxylating ferredoxin subunit
MARHVVARLDEIPEGGRKRVVVRDRPITVFHVKGEYFALYDRCPHAGGSLFAGKLTGAVVSDGPGEYRLERPGEIIRCPWHGWAFDLRTGRSECDPMRLRARAYVAGLTCGSEEALRATTCPVETDETYVFVEL